jgi:hypothetical protein
MPVSMKAFLSVTGGVIPGHAVPEHNRQWSYSSIDYETDRLTPADQPTRFSRMLDEAHNYAKGLSNPAYLNWVKVEWLWV